MKFLFKAIIVCSREEKRFNSNNNYKYSKLANFWLNNNNKINYKILVVLLYILLGLESKKI